MGIQMISGLPPWKHLGINNPVLLYNHVKQHSGPPPINVPLESTEGAAFTAMVERCFRQTPRERPTAIELQEDVFFLQGACCSDDEQSRAAASPGQNTSIAWESLLSPSTPQSRLGLNGRRSSCRRSNSARCPRSPFMSPPIPENKIMNIALIKSPGTSPKCDPSGWPTWARERYNMRNRAPSSGPSPSELAETMGSLAISDDSSHQQSLDRRNLFASPVNNSGYYSEITSSSRTLQGEHLLGTMKSTLHGECLLSSTKQG